MQSELADAWGSFLGGYPWDWFLTLTFREPPGSFRAHRMFDRFASEIEKAANVRIGWFRGDEYGPISGRLHIHALMLNTAHLSRMGWLNEWNRRAGFARILPFDPSKGAAFYCSKYVTKQFGDWDFSEHLEAFKGPRPAVQPSLNLSPTAPAKMVAQSSPPTLAGSSKPLFHNTAEDQLIAALDRKEAAEPQCPQLELIEDAKEK